MKRFITLLLVLIFFSISTIADAHYRSKYNIVIDTDGGQDDFRTINLFCASKDFNINAITTVNGIIPSSISANAIYSILQEFNHQGIPVGQGQIANNAKELKHKNMLIKAWDTSEEFEFPNSVDVLKSAIENEKNKTIIVALGPLTNISSLIKNYPELAENIEYVLWYSNDFQNNAYNYEADKKAYEYLTNTNLNIKQIYSADIVYSKETWNSVNLIKNIYADTWIKFHSEINQNQTNIWDELTYAYLKQATLFSENFITNKYSKVTLKQEFLLEALLLGTLNIEKAKQGVIYNELPTKDLWLRADVRDVSKSIIDKYGYDEFKIIALTSEFHSHLGLFSIVGAKMGLRTMDYFHVGLDEISIETYCGTEPPLSCMIDGLQVGTGSTLGYGTINNIETLSTSPSAKITYNNKEVIFTLKPEWKDKIKNDISALVKKYGIESEIYWIELRKLSLQYWLDMDRNQIFIINESQK